MTYSVSGIKSFIGREGHGFNAYLHHDGRKIAFVTDHANGGCLSFDWLEPIAVAGADADALDAYCKTLPPVSTGGHGFHRGGVPIEDEPMDMDRDLFVTQLVEAEENAKAIRAALKRLLKKRVLFTLDGGVKQTKPLPVINEATLAACAARWPDSIILNRLPFDEAVKLYTELCVDFH